MGLEWETNLNWGRTGINLTKSVVYNSFPTHRPRLPLVVQMHNGDYFVNLPHLKHVKLLGFHTFITYCNVIMISFFSLAFCSRQYCHGFFVKLLGRCSCLGDVIEWMTTLQLKHSWVHPDPFCLPVLLCIYWVDPHAFSIAIKLQVVHVYSKNSHACVSVPKTNTHVVPTTMSQGSKKVELENLEYLSYVINYSQILFSPHPFCVLSFLY